jgi:phosphoglycerol transferase MdoB-like AlkP superfamily enzyme
MSAGLIFFTKKIFSLGTQAFSKWKYIFLGQLVIIALLLLLARGIHERPLVPSTPLLQVNARQLPIAQNSINTFLYSLARKQQQLKPKKYFSRDELDRIVVTNHVCKPERKTDSLIKKNVIICILESFSRCYLMPGDIHKANTPFFDSLIRKSIFFPNAFANGFESNQGIVSILGGLPAFLDEPFYYSVYANTPLKSIGNVLKEKGYNTNFFMGASEDHFGFGKFTRMAGIDNYYSRADFSDDHFYDGNWGIFDEPFLQYGARVLSGKQQPFLAVFFNISSHSPFTIPDIHRQQFNMPGKTPAQRSISYVDYAFRRFFETSKKSSWFRNSIFVFCADHYYYPGSGSYDAVTGSTIPIFIYDPSADTGGINTSLISQIDITPALLSLLNYKGTYTGFGTNVFDSSKNERYVINKPGHIYQVITTDFVLGYDASGEKKQYLYRYNTDSLLKNNLLDSARYLDTGNGLERLLKANIQRYNQALIRRSLE